MRSRGIANSSSPSGISHRETGGGEVTYQSGTTTRNFNKATPDEALAVGYHIPTPRPASIDLRSAS